MRKLTLVLEALTVVAAVAAFATVTEARRRRPSADPVIAYVDHVRGYDHRLKVMDADGSNQTEILRFNDGRYIFHPCWSPDGKKIVFSDGTNLWTIDVKLRRGKPRGRNLTRLTDFDENRDPRNPAWSPLGDEIMYGVRDGLKRIEVIPAEGGDERILWQEGDGSRKIKRYPHDATWSPDGSLIAFWVHRRGRATTPLIRVVDVDTGEVVTKINFDADGLTPTALDWARTQDVLACSVWDSDTQLYSLYTFDLDTEEFEELADQGTNAPHPSWSPDDELLLYNYIVNDSDGPDTYKIKTYEFATGNIETLCSRGWDPDWAR